MKVDKKYAKPAKEFLEKNYEAALKLLYKMRTRDKVFYYLEAGIFNGLKNYLKEYRALKKLLPLLSRSSPADEKVYDDCLNHLGNCCSQLGLIDESLTCSLQVMNTTKNKPMFYESICCSVFNTMFKENASASDFHAIYDKFRSSFTFEPFPKPLYHHDKIRVGFLSGDFYNHVVMKWSWALLTQLDKNLFETHCYSNCELQDNTTERLRSSVDGWQNIYDLTDEAAAKLIQGDEIDILFDLSVHTENNRLGVLAYRPATVQISGIGFTSSTGLKTVDYFLTDVYCIGDSAPYFTEDFIALPHSHVCYTPFDDVIKFQPSTEPPCLKNGYVTFGCFNQYRKITDSMLVVWKKSSTPCPIAASSLKIASTA